MKKLVATAMLGLVLAACGSPNFGIPAATDTFGQSISYNNKVDIIWIIDNSLSMSQHQTTLKNQIPALVQKLNGLKLDYHMGVITTSMGVGGNGGKFLGSPEVLTAATPDLTNLLSSRLVVGQSGDNLERGMDSLLSVLSPSYLNTAAGQAFFRQDALLAVIVLSDEDDHSVRTVSYMTNFLDSVKPRWLDGTRSWMFNFIGVLDLTSQCKTYNNFAEPGLFFMDMADASGGIKSSICSGDFTTALTNIRARILEVLTDFKLSNRPDVSTIVVKINGVLIPNNATNGWTYESVPNLIRFHGTAVPAADASIVIDFKPATAN